MLDSFFHSRYFRLSSSSLVVAYKWTPCGRHLHAKQAAHKRGYKAEKCHLPSTSSVHDTLSLWHVHDISVFRLGLRADSQTDGHDVTWCVQRDATCELSSVARKLLLACGVLSWDQAKWEKNIKFHFTCYSNKYTVRNKQTHHARSGSRDMLNKAERCMITW